MSDPEPLNVEAMRQEMEALRQKVEESYKMASLGRLVASIVHEINTPIGSIFSNNEVIRRSVEVLKKQLSTQAPPTEKALDILDTIASLASVDKIACERISSVIRSLKTFSRVEQGDLRKADIHAILNNTLKLAGCEFRRRIQIVTDFGELPEVDCYAQSLGQVFLNLIVNAGQAVEGEGTVTVRTRLEDGMAHISITDTGRGILPEHHKRVFSAGFTTKPMGVGTGLGLKITREIVEDLHHGTIGFESEPGTGTTFHVRIPVTQKESK